MYRMELALIIVMGVNDLHARFIRLVYLCFSVYGTIPLSQMSIGQVYLDKAMARNSLTLVNYFDKPNEQRTSLLGLCRDEK
jgi:hypothetical protein